MQPRESPLERGRQDTWAPSAGSLELSGLLPYRAAALRLWGTQTPEEGGGEREGAGVAAPPAGASPSGSRPPGLGQVGRDHPVWEAEGTALPHS